jgi:MFS family permease
VNFGFVYAGSLYLIWILFALYGLVIGMTDGVMKAFVSDLVVENRAESFGWFNIILGVATILGNVMGGILWQEYGAFYAFGLSGILSFVATAYLFYKNSLALSGGNSGIKFQAYR